MQMILGQAHPRTGGPRGDGCFVPFVSQKSHNAGVRIYVANPLDGTQTFIGWQVAIDQSDLWPELGKPSHSYRQRGRADRFHVRLLADEFPKALQQKLIVVHRQDANSLRLHPIRSSQYAALLNMLEPGRATPPISGVAHEAVTISFRGYRPILPEVARRLADRAPSPTLIARQHDVIGLISSGMRNKEVAAEVRISEETAEGHVRYILAKSRAHGRAEAVAAIRRRIVHVD